MIETADAVVIGAGIAGAACADALSADGLRVIVVESGVIGGGATAAGMGHILVLDDSEAEFALTRYSRDLWNRLARSLPSEAEHLPSGTLWVAADEEEMQAVRQKAAWYQSRGIRAEALDSKSLTEAEPNLRGGLAGGLRIPDDSLVYAPCAAEWLLSRARRQRTLLRLGSPVREIREGAVTLGDSTAISAGLTICATGTWATTLFPDLLMRPRKGHLAITDRYPGFVRHALIELGYLKSAHGSASESVAFNAQPRKTGQVLIGSSRQYGVTSTSVDAHILSRMLNRGLEYMPALGQLSVIRTWTGFRAATEDKLPIIGPCPGRRGVYLATGHEGLGITTSLGTARLIADMIAGRSPALDASPYLPGRFAMHG